MTLYNPFKTDEPPVTKIAGRAAENHAATHNRFPTNRPNVQRGRGRGARGGRPGFSGRGGGRPRPNRSDTFQNDEPSPSTEFVCESCDRMFFSHQDLQEHYALHVRCPHCRFSSLQQLVDLHVKLVHDKHLASKVLEQSPEEIAEYLAERRRRFPRKKEDAEQATDTIQAIDKKGVIHEQNLRGNKNKPGLRNQRDQENESKRQRQRKRRRNKPNNRQQDDKVEQQSDEQQPSPVFAAGLCEKGAPKALADLIACYSDSDDEGLAPSKTAKIESIVPRDNDPAVQNELRKLLRSLVDRVAAAVDRTKPVPNKQRRRPPPPPAPMSQRKLSLLEKLLAKDIRHERNIILQCVDYVIQNDFFENEPALPNENDLNLNALLDPLTTGS